MLRHVDPIPRHRGFGAVVLALTLIASGAEAADIRGTFKYMDTNGPTPIRRASAEVWYRGPNFWDFWSVIAVLRTTTQGTIAFTDGRSNGTYAIRLFASNDAASVFPTDLHFEPYHVDPGGPSFAMNLIPTSASSILDFTWTFADPIISMHFNLANAVQFGYEYAQARRDPNEVDQIGVVVIQPTSWAAGTSTYHNPSVNTIMIETSRAMEDLTVLHEYGHHLQTSIGGVNNWPSVHNGCETRLGPGGPLINTPQYAWAEAFPTYFAHAVMQAYPLETSLSGSAAGVLFDKIRLETPIRQCPAMGEWSQAAGSTITPDMIEDWVAASLWDLADGPGDPSQGIEAHDSIAKEDVTVFQIFDHELGGGGPTPTIWAFRNAWINRGKDRAGLDCILSAHNILAPKPGCNRSAAVKIVGRFNYDNRSDIAVVGAQFAGTIPVALSNGDGTFRLNNGNGGFFAPRASDERTSKISGDFNHDGLTDIALVGEGGTNIPVALSDGNGGFIEVNDNKLVMFPDLASTPGVTRLAGDFDGDGDTDIALLGPPTWNSIPIASSDGAGGFTETNEPVGNLFVLRAWDSRTTRIAADFTGDGKADILLVTPYATLLTLAVSRGNGAFDVTFVEGGSFGLWASTPGVRVLSGDFNGDGITDVALTGPAGWNTVPLFLSHYNAPFTVVNAPAGDFGGWSSSPTAIRLVGDFNGSGAADLALTGVPGWATVPVAVSTGSSFLISNPPASDFAAWSTTPGATALVGDFNGDGRSDIALTGAAGWGSVPVAFAVSQGNLPVLGGSSLCRFGSCTNTTVTFSVTNQPSAQFATLAAKP